MVIIETSVFTRRITELMGDDEYKAFQEALVQYPDMGSVIQGSSGLRKVRWKLEGKGKSGGVRAIYYWMKSDDQIFMLYVYSKNEQENLTKQQIKLLKQVVEEWSDG